MGILDAPGYSQARANTLFGYASLGSTMGPLGMPHWKQKLALSLLNQSPARILCLGDSTTAGVSADSYTTATGTTYQDTANTYPRQLVSRLNALGIPSAIGMTLPGSVGGLDPHWAFTGGSLFTGAGVGIGGSQGVIMSHVSDSWTVTPGALADTYKIYYWTVSGGGTFSAQATGGSLVSVPTTSGSQTVASQTITAGSASTSNTVSLICTTAGAGCVIFAVEFWNSATPNLVRVLPAGCPGQDSSAFATGTALATYGSRAVTKALAPDVTICSLGINDVYHALPLSTTQTNFYALAADAQISGDMLFLSAIPPSTGNAYGISVSSINAWLLSLGGAYVDLQSRYGTNFFSTGLQTTDKIHPNALGYRDIAMCVADALLR
jgi:lysophospholipase L1-like esterase